MNKFRISAAIVLLAILALSGCASKENKEEDGKNEDGKSSANIITLSPKSIKDIKMETLIVAETNINGNITIPAKIEADQDREAVVGTNLEGRVQKVFVKLGDVVRKGQVLMLIEGAGVGSIKADYIKAKAEYTYAENNLKRQKQLLEQKAGSQKSFYEAEAEYEKALASFNAEDKKIHSIGLDESDVDLLTSSCNHTGGVLRVKSPMSGIIVERNVVTGQQVDPSATAFKIIDPSAVNADGQIYEKDIPIISGKHNISLSVSAWPGKQFQGKITYIGEIIDSETRTVKIRASVQNQGRLLKPEMFAEMSIPLPAGTKGIAVPEESIVRHEGSSFVFVVKNDTTFEKRLVETGGVSNNSVRIVKGLQTGEKIVSKGTFYLKSEMLKSSLEEE